MYICHKVAEIRGFVKEARAAGRTVGFVPTMGYLHQGHLDLMRQAKEQNDLVVVSIFVNPTQFGPREDFSRYPRDMERDVRLAAEVGAEVIFNPEVEEIYPPGYSTYVAVEGLTEKLCGLTRPGHFRGVATVVAKLFNIVQPDRAYFGQKDAQQALVIRRLVADLNMDLEVITVPTRREADGLAMSSRNVYLDPAQRQAALVLSQSLQAAAAAVAAGKRDVAEIRRLVVELLQKEPLAEIDYVELYSHPDLAEINQLDGPGLLAVAVKIGQTRLIDNIILGVHKNVFDHV